MDFRLILKEIKKFPRNDADIDELEDSSISVSKNFIKVLKCSDQNLDQKELINELLLECMKYLKVMCTKGPTLQNLVVNTTGSLSALTDVTTGKFSNLSPELEIKGFQLIANLIVKNETSQDKIWNFMSDVILAKLESDDTAFVNVAAMIVYNLALSKRQQLDKHKIFKVCQDHYKSFLNQPSNQIPDFVHILLDFLLCKTSDGVEIFIKLEPGDQKTALYYIQDYVENEFNETINEELLHHLTDVFKKKSDCILKTVATYVDSIDPQIIVSLLDIIAIATSQEKYLRILKDDRSLFLNLGCLLQTLHKIGKASDSIFSPIQKLEALVPSSDENGDFEKEISFSFKTKLVKSICNLTHKNRKNQELARELEIMLSIFECTSADARNPLIKEWSIMAIRNLCEDNLENQEIVRNLSKVGDAENPILKEMGLESGMLRIGKK